MKIAIDISQIVFEGTGVASYTKNLVCELLKLNQSGKHKYILFGASLRKKSILDEFVDGLKKEDLKFETSFWLLPPTFTSRIWNEIHRVKIERLTGKIDLFHSSDWTQPPTNAKKVTTIHDLVVYKFPQSSHREIVKAHKEKLFWVKKECDCIIVDSIATKNDCQQILNISPEKMRVVPLAAGNGVNDFARQNEADKSNEITRVKNKFNLTKPYILAVGTQEPRKNLQRLIEAAKSVPDIDLVIAGKYGWGETIDRSNNIKILGYVAQNDIQPLYAGSQAYVHPSLYEGFGITVVEAMTLGIPVITSNVSCLPEAGGDAALYVNPENINEIHNKIVEILRLTREKRAILVQKSLDQAKKFSWEKTAKQTLEIYEKLA